MVPGYETSSPVEDVGFSNCMHVCLQRNVCVHLYVCVCVSYAVQYWSSVLWAVESSPKRQKKAKNG